MNKMRQFGLIGKSLKHSFSPSYFGEKFEMEHIENAKYNLYELNAIEDFCQLIEDYSFYGLNVTIPYKESIIPYLDSLSDEARSIGAVNTIEFKDGCLIGHNTDVIGAKISLEKLLGERTVNSAYVLGTGGAAKAIQFVLKQLGIDFKTVSRTQGDLLYGDLDKEHMLSTKLIINTTPLGMYPSLNTTPDIPYDYLTDKHLLFDLVYNPKITLFLKKGLDHDCQIMNGEMMLIEQAEAAWSIWNND